jgi:small conductance mechanosensitive channel
MLVVDKLSATSVTLRLLAKTAPNKQTEVGRELRRRVKLAFDQEGIKSPAPVPQLIPPSPVEEKKAKG